MPRVCGRMNRTWFLCFGLLARQRRPQKTRLVGRVACDCCGRALTHHSRNDGNNQRNADGAEIHGAYFPPIARLCQTTIVEALMPNSARPFMRPPKTAISILRRHQETEPFPGAMRSTVLQWKVRGGRTFQGGPGYGPFIGRPVQPNNRTGGSHVGGTACLRVPPYEPTLDNIYRRTPHSMFGFAR